MKNIALVLSALLSVNSLGCLPAQRETVPLTIEADGGGSLYVLMAGRKVLLKQLGPDQELQGTGVLSPTEVFAAYSTSGGEAGTRLVIFTLPEGRESPIAELGATGSSRFFYNSANGFVVFNWAKGIYMFSLMSAVKLARSPNKAEEFESSLVQVVECTGCHTPGWVNAKTIEYTQEWASGSSRVRVSVPTSAAVIK